MPYPRKRATASANNTGPRVRFFVKVLYDASLRPFCSIFCFRSLPMKTLFRFLSLCLLVAAGLVAAGWWYIHRPLELVEPVDFAVERGQTMRDAAHNAADAGLNVAPEVLYWVARLSGRGDRIVAGGYEATDGISLWELIEKLNRGDVVHAEVLIVEGWNFKQVRAAIEARDDLVQDTLELSAAELLERIGATETHPEGLFFPDTYLFARGSAASEVFRAAYRSMKREVEAVWAERDPNLPLQSPYEAQILASIIEKETGRDDERGLVASVFANRLRIGMRLQTDPTVMYGYGETLEGRLRRRHLDTDHEYNTYTRAGLPPTPIAMPGRASLLAALKPEKSDYLYFVSRGDGTSQFSRTLNEHNRAVNKYIRGKNG